jgi:hypothetical protein
MANPIYLTKRLFTAVIGLYYRALLEVAEGEAMFPYFLLCRVKRRTLK